MHDGPLTADELEYPIVRRFKKANIERALGAELNLHLGYSPGAPKLDETTNHRNGTSGKSVLTGTTGRCPLRCRATVAWDRFWAGRSRAA